MTWRRQGPIFRRITSMFVFPDIADLLPTGKSPKVKSTVLAKLLATIETALESGHTHDQIHAWLEDSGIAIDRKYYQDAIYRLRKKRGPRPITDATLVSGVTRPLGLPAPKTIGPLIARPIPADQQISVPPTDSDKSSFSMSDKPLLF